MNAVVNTLCGVVRGIIADGVNTFKGIPYGRSSIRRAGTVGRHALASAAAEPVSTLPNQFLQQAGSCKIGFSKFTVSQRGRRCWAYRWN